MAVSSIRARDELLTSFTELILDEKFYPRLVSGNNRICKFTRITDKGMQIRGVDVELGINSCKNYYVDEKSANNYMNKNLSTFVLELMFEDSSCRTQKGWFIKDDLLTTHYAFLYPRSKTPVKEICDVSQIDSLEVILCPKRVIKSKILKAIPNLRDLCFQVKNNPSSFKNVKVTIDGKRYGFRVMCSKHLAEKPVNLVTPKKFFINNSLIHEIFVLK